VITIKGTINMQKSGFRLFLMSLPFLLIVFLFAYLPLYGWIYSFYDYHAGLKLSDCTFVGFKHFLSLVNNPITLENILRVLRNTFAMSSLGILISPLPAVFAICLIEVKSKKFRSIIQTLTTLPNFMSWILVFSVAYAMFSVGDGFVNRVLMASHITDTEINFLAGSGNVKVWLTMLGYSLWKGLGWNAIIYLAAIAAIDPQLNEAAIVDGANKFQKIWYVTVPGIMPTYFVLFLLSIANFINSGMEQYFVFENALNKNSIEVLDLYVYNLGMIGQSISFAIAVGMLKSIVSIVLLFVANSMSKLLREETII
jgi:putative aldouronate transport system permease protein